MGSMQFAKIMGGLYILAGLLGFIPGMVSPPADAGIGMGLAVSMGYGYLLGLFPVNVLHNLVHMGIGGWGWVASRSVLGSRTFARSLAIFYGALAVMGLIPGLNTTFGLIPIFGHDVWLHTVTAALAAYFGFGAPAEAVLGTGERRKVA